MRSFNHFLKKNMNAAGLVFLMATSFCFAMFQGGFVSWFIFYSFLPFAAYAMILLFYPLHSITVERNVSKRECQAGETVEMNLTFTRKNRLPLLFLVIEEELPGDMEDSEDSGIYRKALIFPGCKRTISLSYALEGLPRGEHRFQSIRFLIGDFFGLVEKEAIFDSPMNITVFPTYHELDSLYLDQLFNQGQAGPTKKTHREHSVVSGVREYQPGDQLSWINWKATARTSEIMTKEFEVQKNRDVWIILDNQPSISFEESIIAAASFVHSLLKKGIQVGYASTSSSLILPAAAGRNQRRKIFTRLAKERTDETNALADKGRKGNLPANVAVIFIVSDLTREKMELLNAFRTNRGLTMLCMKNPENLLDEEKRVMTTAMTKGIKVSFIEPEQLRFDRTGVMAK
ncbi:hypothetical protein AS888_23825 [Peribacillus simplex]|uniref:DUF58 domain-containing protein n=2 Tax=Peribacillus simplex TaxID=1478 RepID=A0A120GNX7_9BACI|nr:hypothetical protein AS888_23825 [Peribacillus simplex]